MLPGARALQAAALEAKAGILGISGRNALMISVDEKTQIHALDRTHSMLLLRPELVEHRTHDYRRGTGRPISMVPSTSRPGRCSDASPGTTAR